MGGLYNAGLEVGVNNYKVKFRDAEFAKSTDLEVTQIKMKWNKPILDVGGHYRIGKF